MQHGLTGTHLWEVPGRGLMGVEASRTSMVLHGG